MVSILPPLSACSLTLSGCNIKRKVRGCRRQPKPPVLVRLQVLLEELLCFISQNEGKVSAALLAPSLGIEKWPLQSHKLVARAFKTFLLLWAWESLSIFGAARQAEEENHQKHQNGCKSVAIHLCTCKLFRFSRSILPLKGTDVINPASA